MRHSLQTAFHYPHTPRNRFQNFIALIVILVVAVVGIYFLVMSHAASPYASQETSGGKLTCPAAIATDSTASGGKTVQFGGSSPCVKPALHGLLYKWGEPIAGTTPAVQAFVIDVYWDQLQPNGAGDNASNVPTSASDPSGWTIINNDLAYAQAHNMAVKLRVEAGINAPNWVKVLDGGPIPWSDCLGGPGVNCQSFGTIGHWWDSDFGTYYQDLQNLLASYYDTNPLLREVVVDRCTTIFSEPFIEQTRALSINEAALAKSDFTTDAARSCEEQEINQSAAAWHDTNLAVSFNPFDEIEDPGYVPPGSTTPVGKWEGTTDETYTQTVMNYCRQQLGSRCVLENNSLDTDRSGDYGQMYDYMASLGPPITFQTADPSKVCGGNGPPSTDYSDPPCQWRTTLDLALQYKATAVELQMNYNEWDLQDSSLGHGLIWYDQQLDANNP
jgi:hypothetical protein